MGAGGRLQRAHGGEREDVLGALAAICMARQGFSYSLYTKGIISSIHNHESPLGFLLEGGHLHAGCTFNNPITTPREPNP